MQKQEYLTLPLQNRISLVAKTLGELEFIDNRTHSWIGTPQEGGLGVLRKKLEKQIVDICEWEDEELRKANSKIVVIS